MSGTLYLCATPIGNLEDITYRAARVLGEVDLIAAEDTRHTRQLLNHLQVQTPMISYHLHSREQREEELVNRMLAGESVALVSDAGTPGLSDPGEELVRRALAAQVPVVALPGASAVVVALTVSGLNTRRFVFEGFLPRRRGERERHLLSLRSETRTLVCFEAPHRLLATLEAMLAVWGDRQIAAARELTKRFEEVVRGPLEEVIAHFREYPPRGEFTLVIEGAVEAEAASGEMLAAAEAEMERLLQSAISPREAARQAGAQYQLRPRTIYQQWLRKHEE